MKAFRSGRPGAVMWVSMWVAAWLGPMAAAAQEEASQGELRQKLEAAQQRLNSAASEVADLTMALSEEVLPHVMPFMERTMQRAMLGVNIGASREGERDEGVEVVSVSPGGAAEAAGLKAGDVLMEVNGKALKREGAQSPRAKLMSAMREVKAGETVAVKYRRDGKVSSADVVAQSVTERGPIFAVPSIGVMSGRLANLRAEGVFGTAELVSLTPQLGQYFGTDKGLLVVRAPADSRLKLEDGDVIVDIDGRVPSGAAHAMRILGSYQAGEKVKLNVLRMKKRMSFEVTIPEEPRERAFERSPWRQPAVMEHGLPAAPALPVELRRPMDTV